MDNKSAVKFGIIGCGVIAKRFAKALGMVDGCELYAAAARELARAESFVSELGGIKAYGSYTQLINDPEVDVIYISLIHNLHAETAKQCIDAGKAVICEKPFFISRDEADDVIAFAKRKNVLIMEAMWSLCLPPFLKAKEWLESGKIGNPKMVEAGFSYNFPFTSQVAEHRIFNPNTAGGALYDVGVYPIEFIMQLLGQSPSAFQALHTDAPTGVDETAAVIMRFDCGAIGIAKTSIAMNADSKATIYGTLGRIELDNFWDSRVCTAFDNSGNQTDVYKSDYEEGFIFEIMHFAELYRSGKTESPLIPLSLTENFSKIADSALKNK